MEPGYFSEDCLDSFSELLDYPEDGEIYDFTRCIRPDGSAYGTRGACIAPNKVAPKQDIPLTGKKDFLAGGGVTAVGKGLSSMQVVNRGRAARAQAFKAGGGVTALTSGKGLTTDQIVQRGAQARAAAVKAGGGSKPGASAKQLDSVARRGVRNRAEAFKAGGGKAALAKGESLEDVIKRGASSLRSAYEAGGGTSKWKQPGVNAKDVIAQGKRNLKEAFKAGGGEAARAQGLTNKQIIERGRKALADAYRAGGGDTARAKSRDTKKVIAEGKKALEGAAKAGGGSVRKGQDVLADPIGASKRSTLEAGGGKAMVDKVSQAMSKSLGRKLTAKEVEDITARVAGRGVENLDKLFKAGGGSAAVSKGKTVDEVISQGKVNTDRAMARSAESASRMGKPLTPKEMAAYRAGGGDAAAKKNKGGVDEVIDAGSRELKEQKRKREQEKAQSLRNRLDKGSRFS